MISEIKYMRGKNIMKYYVKSGQSLEEKEAKKQRREELKARGQRQLSSWSYVSLCIRKKFGISAEETRREKLTYAVPDLPYVTEKDIHNFNLGIDPNKKDKFYQELDNLLDEIEEETSIQSQIWMPNGDWLFSSLKINVYGPSVIIDIKTNEVVEILDDFVR